MNGQHFREVVDIICYTVGCKKSDIAEWLGIPMCTMYQWFRRGVSKKQYPRVSEELRDICRGY